MGTEDSPTKFVVLVDGSARFWGHSRAEAQDRYQQGRQRLVGEPTIDIREVDGDLYCPVPLHTEPLLFEDDGWVSCPECGRVAMG